MGVVDKVPEDRGVGAEPHQAGGVETTGVSDIGMGQVSGNEALNCLPQGFVSGTEEKGVPGQRCPEFSMEALSQSEGDDLEEKLVGIETGKAQRLSVSWKSSDPWRCQVRKGGGGRGIR